MITGYNTDVRHQDVVFHVQTEDKGSGNPFIESLVYVGGQVLATKRASYADLLAEGKDEKAIVALMDHQHRTMIAAIRHGKFDDKLAALSAGRQTGQHAAVGRVRPPGGHGRCAPSALPRPALAVLPAAPPSRGIAGRPVAGWRAAPAASGRPPGRLRGPERSLDQVILEYLTSEADQEQLLLTLDGDQELDARPPGRPRPARQLEQERPAGRRHPGLGQDDLDRHRAAHPGRRPHRRRRHPAPPLRDPPAAPAAPPP